MALIVEDGSQVAGAESYESVAGATAYHLARGNSTWALLTTGQSEEALRRATDYMEQMYRARWKGWRVSSTQVLCWPRAGVEIPDKPYGTLVATDEIPQAVKDACSEYALKAGAADLAPDLTRGKAAVTVGPIAVTYDTASPEAKRYRALDALLKPFLKASSAN